MTQSTHVPSNAIELPTPNPDFPILTRAVSNVLFPENGENPVTWMLSGEHPLVAGHKVVRMFVNDDGVEIYSVSADGRRGMRNLVPMAQIRLIEEAMTLDLFVEELYDAESRNEEPEPDPEPDPGPVVPSANELPS